MRDETEARIWRLVGRVLNRADVYPGGRVDWMAMNYTWKEPITKKTVKEAFVEVARKLGIEEDK